MQSVKMQTNCDPNTKTYLAVVLVALANTTNWFNIAFAVLMALAKNKREQK